jgi:signal transduction histidine kinase/CheY-like chemotaxis protein
MLEERLTGLRRELVVTCDAKGTVVSADPAAYALAGIVAGRPLLDYAVPGTEAKLIELLRRAAEGPVDGWEACLTVRGLPATLNFRAAACPGPDTDPREGDVPAGTLAIVADLVPQEFGTLMSQMQEGLSELASLHRETERQQRELLRRNEELVRLNHELEDAARGMVALHAEVDEKNDSLRRLAEVKSRVVSNVSHEFRTPLNSIIGLSKMMLGEVDGPLTAEQQKQLGFIRGSAESLAELVNDLLDLSKIEAGRVALRPGRFTADKLFGALRGMMRPLLADDDVDLRFETAAQTPLLDTDEGKVSQILKNFISNAAKFTEHGSIVVSAKPIGHDRVRFSVADTGVGIAEADQERVFEEFNQIENRLQRRTKGTGLGLSISRHLAGILGGRVGVESKLGAGSTFFLEIPAVHAEVEAMATLVDASKVLDPGRAPVLVVEDDRQTLFLYERYLRHAGFQVIPARTVDDARVALKHVRPAAVVLDIMLEGETTWRFLSDLKSDPATSAIPALVVTVTNREAKARALGADEFFVKPIDEAWLVKKLADLARRTGPISTVLVIDDDEVARYMLRRALAGTSYRVLEAPDGAVGVRLARTAAPQVIFLDLVMPGMGAFDVIDELKLDPRTRNIPIIIHSSKTLADEERLRLEADAASILPKHSLSREVALARIREALVNAGAGLDPPAGPAAPAGGNDA